MTEIQPYGFGEATALQLATVTAPTRGERSREWMALFFETARAAEVLAQTDFVPPTMKGKSAQVAAVMMKGYELDIDPLDALGNVYSVHGQIGFKAEFMRRRIIQAGHEFEVVEANDSRAIVRGRRKGAEKWHEARFTAEQARKAKIDIGSYPEDKLIARATSRLVKRTFPDVMSGAAIAEDLEDEARVVVAQSERADAPAAATVQRKRKPRAVAVPAPAEEVAPGGYVDVPLPDMPPLPDEDPADAGQEIAAEAINPANFVGTPDGGEA